MSIPFDKKVLENLRSFGMERFGSMQKLAEAMGVRPQNLNAYLKGERKLGPKYVQRLKEIGFRPDNTNCVIEVTQNIPIDIKGAIALSNTPLERLAQLVGVAPAVLSSWQDGSATPTPTQLSTLFNLVVALGLSAQTAAKQDPPTQATA
jgi:DNA-binding transcriptional regulator YdaS (Cro superfamily)